MVINPIVGVEIPIIRIPIKGGMTIPNIGSDEVWPGGVFVGPMESKKGYLGQTGKFGKLIIDSKVPNAKGI